MKSIIIYPDSKNEIEKLINEVGSWIAYAHANNYCAQPIPLALSSEEDILYGPEINVYYKQDIHAVGLHFRESTLKRWIKSGHRITLISNGSLDILGEYYPVPPALSHRLFIPKIGKELLLDCWRYYHPDYKAPLFIDVLQDYISQTNRYSYSADLVKGMLADGPNYEQYQWLCSGKDYAVEELVKSTKVPDVIKLE